MAERSDRRSGHLARLAVFLLGAGLFFWLFPPVRIKRLATAAAADRPAAQAVFDPKAAATRFWHDQLLPATSRASDLAAVVRAVRENPEVAAKSFGKTAGVGSAYFFVRGTGKVVTRERNVLRLAVDGAPGELVALRTGPVFGNTVRDGTGLLDVNGFPGLQEYNALAAELNALVEQQVLPLLREKANVGAVIEFAGCAEAPESAEERGEPLFTVVPVRAEVR